MIDYSKGKIYKIVGAGKTYIGSTTSKLYIRLNRHRCNKRKYELGEREYTTSYEVLGHPDTRIELIENFPCASKVELLRREAEWIRTTECVNKIIPLRTMAEWRTDNAEKVKEYTKKRNSARVCCELCGKQLTKVNLKRHLKACGKPVNHEKRSEAVRKAWETRRAIASETN
jgi:hypothetical protein